MNDILALSMMPPFSLSIGIIIRSCKIKGEYLRLHISTCLDLHYNMNHLVSSTYQVHPDCVHNDIST